MQLVAHSDSTGEKHHIVPVSINKNLKKEPANIVKLTVRKHYIAHLLLIRLFTGTNRAKMVRALWFLSKRSSKINSRLFESYRKEWAHHMKDNNPMSKVEISQKISSALLGRTKTTHEYIRVASEKKAKCNVDNSEWLRVSRLKFKNTVDSMSVTERKNLFGHEMTEEIKQKISIAKTGKNKTNSAGVRLMAQKKILAAAKMTVEERKAKFSSTTGYKWYHCDETKSSRLMLQQTAPANWLIGRKFYEN